MGKILEFQIQHVLPFKMLIEVLKEILNDVTIEAIRDDTMNKVIDRTDDEMNDATDNSESANDSDNVNMINSDENTKNNNKKKKNKKNKKEKEIEEEVSSGGLKITTVDPSKSLLIQMVLNAKEFSIFKCKPSTHDICISLVNLHKLLKSLDKEDILTMSIDDDDKQNLILKVDNHEKNCISTYRLKLMDLDKKSYRIPPTAFDAKIILNATEFHKICREMSNIGEHMEIKVTPNGITYTCEGEVAKRNTTYYLGDGGIKITFSFPNKINIVQGIFELKYLVLFTKCANLCDNIEIYMKNNYPLCIRYKVATLGKILLCLSPVADTHTKGNFSDDENDDDVVEGSKN